jgi:hypothetical protein
MTGRRVALILLVLGGLLLSASATLVYLPAGYGVAGALLVALAVLFDFDKL